jgi:hypothetical protein
MIYFPVINFTTKSDEMSPNSDASGMPGFTKLLNNFNSEIPSRHFERYSENSQIGNQNYWLFEHMGNGGERHENLGRRCPENKICGEHHGRHGEASAGRIVFFVVGPWMSKGKRAQSFTHLLCCC